MLKIKDWIEKSNGYYRFVVAAKVCYEIIITKHECDKPIEEAIGNLYLTGEWANDNASDSVFTFERELVYQGETVEKLMLKAKEDMVNSGWL